VPGGQSVLGAIPEEEKLTRHPFKPMPIPPVAMEQQSGRRWPMLKAEAKQRPRPELDPQEPCRAPGWPL